MGLLKRAEVPHGGRKKDNSKRDKRKPARQPKSTVEGMMTRAAHLCSHSDYYESNGQIKPFITFASHPKFKEDPERALLILNNCLVLRTNKGFESDSAEIVKRIAELLGEKKRNHEIMTRLEKAAMEAAGEEEIELTPHDKKVGFILTPPKAEGPIKTKAGKKDAEESEPSLEDREPTVAELAKLDEVTDSD